MDIDDKFWNSGVQSPARLNRFGLLSTGSEMGGEKVPAPWHVPGGFRVPNKTPVSSVPRCCQEVESWPNPW